MNEASLLEHVYGWNRRLDSSVLIPPGDDMGMVKLGSGAEDPSVLVAVDQVVEGRHFRAGDTPWRLVGRKAVARNVSDVAAMAARPVATLAAATLRPSMSAADVRELFDAVRDTAEEFACPLIGGDIAMHAVQKDEHREAAVVCSVTILAVPHLVNDRVVKPITRAGARLGDVVFVTGRLGGSLQVDGSGRHLTFQPRVAEALVLAEQLGNDLHAMIDLSDGLARDAGHLAVMSSRDGALLQVAIDSDRIPLTEGIADWRRGMADGEDYELCFAVADRAADQVPARIGAVEVTRIGTVRHRVRPTDPPVIVLSGRESIDVSGMGFIHGSEPPT